VPSLLNLANGLTDFGSGPRGVGGSASPSANELQRLVEQIAVGVGQALERRDLIERDIENEWLVTDFEAGPLDDLVGHSITYRIAVGPRAARAALMDTFTDDDLFLDAVDAIVLDALVRIGKDPRARYAFFRRLLAVAQEEAGDGYLS
jgi:hypothetical protein